MIVPGKEKWNCSSLRGKPMSQPVERRVKRENSALGIQQYLVWVHILIMKHWPKQNSITFTILCNLNSHFLTELWNGRSGFFVSFSEHVQTVLFIYCANSLQCLDFIYSYKLLNKKKPPVLQENPFTFLTWTALLVSIPLSQQNWELLQWFLTQPLLNMEFYLPREQLKHQRVSSTLSV